MNDYMLYFVIIPLLCIGTVVFSFTIGKIVGRREGREKKVLEKHGIPSR